MSIATSSLLAGAPRPRWHPNRLAAFVTDLAARPESWSSLVRFDADERVALLLDRNAERDLWLLTWLPGQGTGMHDHGGSSGAFAVTRGSLRELSPRHLRIGDGAVPPIRAAGRRLDKGQVRVVGSGTLHDVRNPYEEPAVSLHAYSPPLSTMSYFDSAFARTETTLIQSAVRVTAAR